VLYNADNQDESITFPFPPPFTAHSAAVKLSWSVAKRGGISRPRGRQEKTFNFQIDLPSDRDKFKPYVQNWRPPSDIIDQLERWHAPVAKQGARLRFVVSSRNVDATVYISTLDAKHQGIGEIGLTLELTEWRVFSIRYDGEDADTGADAGANNNPVQHDPPSGPDTPDQYAVQSGDTLWAIAQTELGDGARWQEIWQLNQGVEMPSGATFDDPDAIEPGMVLQLPSLSPGDADTNDPGESEDAG
jgi:LysM repeat protein